MRCAMKETNAWRNFGGRRRAARGCAYPSLSGHITVAELKACIFPPNATGGDWHRATKHMEAGASGSVPQSGLTPEPGIRQVGGGGSGKRQVTTENGIIVRIAEKIASPRYGKCLVVYFLE